MCAECPIQICDMAHKLFYDCVSIFQPTVRITITSVVRRQAQVNQLLTQVKMNKETDIRIIQTFWSGDHNPLECGYGWSHAEHNLMSWALSCHSLREHYSHTELYTDQRGYETLVEILRLPYTKVHVVYDDSLCLPQHWALAKIRTYAMQTEPFLHIDGDIYVPRPLSQEALSAPLVAQNREVGTVYYRRMMENVQRHGEIKLPPYITDALRNDSVASYNMGMFGGTDLGFIHRYCQESFSFLKRNHMNDRSHPNSRVCCNILFEQVFFAVLADLEDRKVTSMLGRAVRDEGYSGHEFCDLSYWSQRPFFHLLGGHKHNPYNVDMLRLTLLRLYPDVLERITSLFYKCHKRLSADDLCESTIPSIERSIAQYEDVVEKIRRKWSHLSNDGLLQWERELSKSIVFEQSDEDARKVLIMECNPWLEWYHFHESFHPLALHLLHRRLGIEEQYPLTDVVMVPRLFDEGIREIPVVNVQKKALLLLQERPMVYGELEETLMKDFTFYNEESRSKWRLITERQIAELIHKGVIATMQMYD